jgi:DNA polymerase-1
MEKKLFLLDGMALVYRAHFALIARPIFTSKGVNSSALYGFTQTLLEILKNQQPTHLAVAFDTDAPTHRHTEYKEYKATRQTMPEDLSLALPHVRRMLEAFRVPVLTCDGFEADDIIGTLVRKAEKEGFKSYMVTPDKDFGQLIDENTFLYKPSRMGDGVEVFGVPEIQKRWNIQRPEQVVDVLALMGDSSDNIPGVPGIGEKTAMKLVGQFGTLENLLARSGELTGKLKENVEKNRELAEISKRLATIICDAPCDTDLDSLKVQSMDEEKVKQIFAEFEFNSIGKRIFGNDFKAGRGFQPAAGAKPHPGGRADAVQEDLILTGETQEAVRQPAAPAPPAKLKTLTDVPHQHEVVESASDRKKLLESLKSGFAFSSVASPGDNASLAGIAFSVARKNAPYPSRRQEERAGPLPEVLLTKEGERASFYISFSNSSPDVLEEFRPIFESAEIAKTGHNLKRDLRLLRERGISVGGKLFDTMVAHSLIEPDMRHALEYLSETHLGYTPIALAGDEVTRPKPSSTEEPAESAELISDEEQPQEPVPATADEKLESLPPRGMVYNEKASEWAMERADLTLQLRAVLEPLLKEKAQERVFYEIESPLLSVLMEMEYEGIKVDAAALADFGAQLAKEISELEKTICRIAGMEFNLGSPKQLGHVLFEVLKICEKPKKTRTGQYATDEQTLMSLAPESEIVQKLLDYRAASKLKSTYADALPLAISPRTGRIHTTFQQVATATGRLNSQDPNLQNIPIRRERGQEIRKAFIPRGKDYKLLSADYSQIELRIIASISKEAAMIEAFKTGADIHTATAAKVYGVFPEMVTAEMRRKAKMVNYGIAYGISAFGLAQRLSIPRKEAAEIIDNYFKQFPGIRRYMDETIQFARDKGYVETVTGRRRYLRDVRSSNSTVRGSAERNAINAPIQGTAADMIKIAMVHIHNELRRRNLKTKMLLQVHDELVFDLYAPEEPEVRALVEEKMRDAIPLAVTVDVEMGVGENWLEAH